MSLGFVELSCLDLFKSFLKKEGLSLLTESVKVREFILRRRKRRKIKGKWRENRRDESKIKEIDKGRERKARRDLQLVSVEAASRPIWSREADGEVAPRLTCYVPVIDDDTDQDRKQYLTVGLVLEKETQSPLGFLRSDLPYNCKRSCLYMYWSKAACRSE